MTTITAPHQSSIRDEFIDAFRRHAAGVAVVTADAGDGPVGLTATSVSSVSADPPLLVFSLSGRSSSAPAIRRASTLVVHLLGADQLQLAQLFATSGVDRFADRSRWSRLSSGEPYLPAARTWLRGHVLERIPAGDATVVLVQALEFGGAGGEASGALVYHDRTWHRLDDRSTVETRS